MSRYEMERFTDAGGPFAPIICVFSCIMRVLFFAQLKDAAGCAAVEFALTSPLDGEQLWMILIEKFPALAEHRKNVRLARNWEYADAQTRFTDVDEVALIPPVSGG